MKVKIQNGFRTRAVRLHEPVRLRAGIPLFAGVLLMFIFWCVGLGVAAGVSLGAAPIIAFNKEGLTGDNLALVNDLEKRMALVPKELQDQVINGLIEGKLNERLASLKDVNGEELKKMLAEGPEGIRAIIKAQGEKIAQLELKRSEESDLSIRSQIEKWKGVNKAALEDIKNGKKVTPSPLEIRVAASPMTPAASLTSVTAANNAFISTFERQPGIIDLIRVQPTFWDYIRKGRTSSKTYVWVNKYNPQGDAAFIAPGAPKPGISFELRAETSVAKKIAESLKTATELLEDVDGFQSFVNDELAYILRAKINTTLSGTGAGDANTPAGIGSYASAYTLNGVSTINANYWDALRAMCTQLKAGNFQGQLTAFVNPVDKANMDLTKAVSQGQLFQPSQLPCAVIEDNNVTVGYAMVALLDYYNIKIYKDYTIAFGWEDDDFTKNLITVIGEVRLHQYVSAAHAGFVVRDTFANVLAAIDDTPAA